MQSQESQGKNARFLGDINEMALVERYRRTTFDKIKVAASASIFGCMIGIIISAVRVVFVAGCVSQFSFSLKTPFGPSQNSGSSTRLFCAL